MLENTIINLFSRQSQISNKQSALELDEHALTYLQLDEKSNQLAHYLLKKGIKNNTLVPILIDRSFEMIIGILGILKAGATYVPIDPAYPIERISYILNDLEANILLSKKNIQANFSGDKIFLDTHWDKISLEPTTTPNVLINGQDLAYIIYTSGSTGKPKGVMVQHESLFSFIKNQVKFYGINPTDRILMFSSYAFDAAVEQMFLALTAGATLLLLPEERLLDIDQFTTYINEKKINHLDVTPGFLENLDPLKCKAVERVVCGGDVCRVSLYQKWANQVTFYNVYGPTEVTVTCVAFKGDKTQEQNYSVLPIGKPLAGNTIHLLNEEQQPVGENQVGEIYIGGAQLAKGYYNNPELTEKSFIALPYFNEQIFYKTGDQGKWLADGNIEFKGRIDDQVKIRGFRIEPGEIENVLQGSPFVDDCVILTKDGIDEQKQLVAFVVPTSAFDKTKAENYLQQKLPEYMVPRLWVERSHIPLTVNGKIDRKSLVIPDYSDLIGTTYIAPKIELEQQLAQIWKNVLGVKRVGMVDNFFDLGGNSLLAQKLILSMQVENIKIPVTQLYQYPTIAGVTEYLNASQKVEEKRPADINERKSAAIAVIGMAGRFPGADTVDKLWTVLTEGKETTTFFSDEELDSNIPIDLKTDSLYVKARGIIEDATLFDPEFFGINKKLAELMDPQQRVFLEIAWEILERAGHLPSKVKHKTGVFAGCGPNFYYENNVLSHHDKIDKLGKLQVTTVNDKDYIASRTAYHLNLKGPAININSACSTSLLAILEAVNSLRSGQCEVAIAGGSSINASIKSGHLYAEGSILSKDGHCAPFDEHATGTVFSDGCGAVLLKRLDDAQRDGDTIFAVIKGVGVSNDGNDKASFTAPSAIGQADAILSAIQDAGVNTCDISYIETHGTGTPIGDPIEFDGLLKAFGKQNDNQYCAIGSIKSNFGHLTEAAGVASFIKTCLSLHHKKLVPSLGFKISNKHIDFPNSPFFVNQKLCDWKDENRIAGVSSFGVGGTNVHVILSSYENPVNLEKEDKPFELITWSAKSETSLDAYGRQLEEFCEQQPLLKAGDLAFSLHRSRYEFNFRQFAVVSDHEPLTPQLVAQRSLPSFSKQITGSKRDLVFTFPGQGAQYLNMGKDLYDHYEIYKTSFDECIEILNTITGENIKQIIFSNDESLMDTLNNTKYTQPAIFIISYSLAKLWMSWGYQPQLLCGHSVGEYVAATLSGIFSLPDALKLIATRGEMISKLPKGDMLSVRLDYRKAMEIISPDLSIAAINTPNLCVIAGESEAINNLSLMLEAQNIPNRLLRTSHAFHSAMMDPIMPEFKAIFEDVSLSIPKIPLISTITGKLLSDEEALDRNYWVNHLRATVNYSASIHTILEEYDPIFLETGPGQGLTVMTNQIANVKGIKVTPIACINSKENECKSILTALGNLWNAGFSINHNLLHNGRNRAFIALPGYSFDRKKYWVEPAEQPQPIKQPQQTNNKVDNATQKEMTRQKLIQQVKNVLEISSGIELEQVDIAKNFIEIGLDSLLLTQIAASLKKEFNVPVTFRQLNEECASIDLLVNYLQQVIPAEMPELVSETATPQQLIPTATSVHQTSLSLLSAQLELIAKQIQLLNGTENLSFPTTKVSVIAAQQPAVEEQKKPVHETLSEAEKKEIAKPFGATPKIDLNQVELDANQLDFLYQLTKSYNLKTLKSKEYTSKSRPFMADPRVVTGFKLATKELVYPIVMKRSSGSRMWDVDGNEYIDALNGFGANLLGYQPDCIKEALHDQIENGFEVGPQHHLAADVAKLVCEFTNFDRAGLCSTGSEAVLGCIRLARTVTGRSTIVAFTGSYHGIFDEVLVRGTKKLKSFPAAAGIMPEAVQNILILDYGTEETLTIIKEKADEIAGVLVEPIQSRRPDFVPIEFIRKLRHLTEDTAIPLIFDEVITGFRMHPGGAQAIFGIQADLAAYGKVVGAGIPIGVIAGKKYLMDALDGGHWNYGDQSIPEVGITYFAGTFVRHPLALAAAKASLNYMKQKGGDLQASINNKGVYISKMLNGIFRDQNLPITVVGYGSLWKVKFEEEIPFSELLFVLMREKGIHILDGFPCFMTEATTYSDIDTIINAFTISLNQMITAGFFPGAADSVYNSEAIVIDNSHPPIPGARLGKDKNGNIAWFIEDPNNTKLFLQIDMK